MKRQLACLILLCMVSSALSEAQAPATTTIGDTIYRADSTPAAGTLLISWPAFATATGRAVAAGQKSITIGAGGAVSVSLVPNEGATPSGTYYRVVYKLNDDGVRADVVRVITPAPRTAADAENAALALLDDLTLPAWAGEYEVWNDFLPGGATSDVFPGDAVVVDVPSRVANFTAIVRDVAIEMADPSGERVIYKIAFANDAAEPPGIQTADSGLREALDLTATTSTAGTSFIADLPAAEVTNVTSTTVSIDTGVSAPAGGGFEVRRSDTGWGQEYDRNLVGSFTTQSFTVTRLTRIVDFYVRQFDNSSPPKYSRYSTALHIDRPL